MYQHIPKTLKSLPRDELEAFAADAAVLLRRQRSEMEASNLFVAGLSGFLLGALVAASGLIVGLGLAL
jgi:hypothetical protein